MYIIQYWYKYSYIEEIKSVKVSGSCDHLFVLMVSLLPLSTFFLIEF